MDSLSSPGSEITSKLNSDNCNVLNKPVVMYQMQLDLSTGIFKKIECINYNDHSESKEEAANPFADFY